MKQTDLVRTGHELTQGRDSSPGLLRAGALPPLIEAAGKHARIRAAEFFAASIRNANTRVAYGRAVTDFCSWLETCGLTNIVEVQTLHVAAFVEQLAREKSVPTVKLRLAAIRTFLDYLVTGGLMPFNPAAAVRGPRHSVKRGKTTVLSAKEARTLLDSIADTGSSGFPDILGLRDRALIGLMVYSLARVSAALAMKVEDVFVQDHRLWVRLKEKGGKRHEMPCHHNLEIYLRAWLEQSGLKERPKAFLFPALRRGSRELGLQPLARENAYTMVRRRALAAGVTTKVGNHTFRATGITAYLRNGGSLERAAAMANHASTRTTQIYDRRPDDVTLDEVERIGI